MTTAREKRGSAGQVFLYVFYGFNVLMVWWLVSYWGQVAPSLHTGSHAQQTGAAIGTTLGTGFIIFIWGLGSVITGLLAILTRGRRTYVEVDDEPRGSGHEQPAHPKTFQRDADTTHPDNRQTQFGRATPHVRTTVMRSSASTWSWSGVLFWAALVICGLIFLGAVGQIVDPEGAKARREVSETKPQESAAQPQRDQMKEMKEVASSFSDRLTVDNIRLGKLPEDTLAYVTVRVPTKIKSVKCAMTEGGRYLGVGQAFNASPPAVDVLVTIPGQDYDFGSSLRGSSLRADCSSD